LASSVDNIEAGALYRYLPVPLYCFIIWVNAIWKKEQGQMTAQELILFLTFFRVVSEPVPIFKWG
jgi:hypothetical protein